MRTSLLSPKFKRFINAACLVALLQMLCVSAAFSQIDYYSDQKQSGFRVGLGMGLTALRAVYDITPLKPAYVGNVDYCFNSYFNVGIEAQSGTIKGVDNHHYYYYSSSTDSYTSVTANVRVGVGHFYDFDSHNKFLDAIKRTYIGVGAGFLRTDIQFTIDETLDVYGPPVPQQTIPDLTFDFGTYIDLRNVLGRDKFELNPKIQVSYLPNKYFDGFVSRQSSTLHGVYDLVSVSLRYKF